MVKVLRKRECVSTRQSSRPIEDSAVLCGVTDLRKQPQEVQPWILKAVLVDLRNNCLPRLPCMMNWQHRAYDFPADFQNILKLTVCQTSMGCWNAQYHVDGGTLSKPNENQVFELAAYEQRPVLVWPDEAIIDNGQFYGLGTCRRCTTGTWTQ